MSTQKYPQPDSRFINEIPFQVLVEQSLVGIYLIQDDVIKYCNHAMAAQTGHTPEQIIGKDLSIVIAPDSLNKVRDNVRKRIADGLGANARYFHQLQHVDGHLVDAEVHGHAIYYEGRPAIAGVSINVTQQLNYERELKESNRQLQLLGRYINNLRERQRQGMARDIHDVLGGLLTSIKMNATRLLSKSEPEEIIEIAEDITALAQESIDFARSKSEQLYPATLNYLGLVPTIENLLKQHLKRGLKCTFKLDGEIPPLAPEIALVIYRTVQESITNVIRHAQANQVEVSILCQEGKLQVRIEDNGIGFAASSIREGAIGLLFMKERASEFGGVLTTTTPTAGGTRILLNLPATSLAPEGSADE